MTRRLGWRRVIILGLMLPSLVYVLHMPLMLSGSYSQQQLERIPMEADGHVSLPQKSSENVQDLKESPSQPRKEGDSVVQKPVISSNSDNQLLQAQTKEINITEILTAKKMGGVLLEMKNYIKLFKESLIKAANDSKKGKSKEKQNIIDGNLKKELQEFEEKQNSKDRIPHYFDTLTMDIVNPYTYKYLINNKTLCTAVKGNLTYLIYVHSAPGNRRRRDNLRNTWGQVNLFTQFTSRIVFFVGRTNDKIQSELEEEVRLYGDIIQSDYTDAYRNLTYKAMGAMKWISDYCPNVKYIFKSDDDTYINMPALLHRLTHEFADRTRFILGMIWQFPSLHIQRPGKLCSKWCIPFSVLPGLDHYPTYASGSFYVMTRDLTQEVYDMAIRTPFFWVDDAYMTGIVVTRIANLEHINISKAYRFNIPIYKTSLEKEPHKLIVTLTRNQNELWKFHLDHLDKRELAILGKQRLTELLKVTHDQNAKGVWL